jgi:hypothetical protein
MVGRRVVFTVVVGSIELAFDPADLELMLSDTVTDPVKAHVDRFGSFLFDRVVGYARGGTIVGNGDSGGLLVAHFLEANAERSGIFAVVEETTSQLGLSSAGYNLS